MEKWHIVIILCANYFFYCCYYPRYGLTPILRFLTVKQWLLNQQTKMKQPFICMQKQLCVRICFMCVCGIIIPASGFLQLAGSPGNLHIARPKYQNFTISPSSEYSQLISFRIGWLDLLALQGTLKSLLECHNSKASIVHHSAFFMVQFHTWLLGKPKLWLDGPLLANRCLYFLMH